MGRMSEIAAERDSEAGPEQEPAAVCEHCKDPWQKFMRAPNGEYMHRAVHGCEIVWNKCRAREATQ